MSTSSLLQTDWVDISSEDQAIQPQPVQPQAWVASTSDSTSILWAKPASSTTTQSTTSSTGATGSFVSAQAFSNGQGAGGSAIVTTFGNDGSNQYQTAQTQVVQDFVPGATSSNVEGSAFTTGNGTATSITVAIPAPTPLPTNSPPSDTLTPSPIPPDFDPTAYLAANFDLIQVFGYDLEAATSHYQDYGQAEGRSTTFDADDYLASHGDLIRTFGYDLAAATRHYVQFGASEGRGLDQFNEVAYLNAYSDLQAAFGQNYALATQHYINYGYGEGRVF